MRIGIYGGTFNPPHRGHVHAAQAAQRALQLDKLLIVPDNTPPHKVLPAGSPSNAQRLEMVRLAFDGAPGCEVSEIELQREGPSYSVDTVRQVRELYPDAELWLLMGCDMLEILPAWRHPRLIMEMAQIAVFARGDAGEQEMFDSMLPRLKANFGATVQQIPLEPLQASSSGIRASLAAGKTDLLAEPVLGYILREQLYGTRTDLKHLSPEALRPIALSYLRHKRIAHVLGTEQEAAALAGRYGVDVTAARIGALLHDCTKKLDMEAQLALCETYGIALDDMERHTPKLLHAKTGAALARDVFGVSDAVYEAIRWHTTGKADMTPLEKVLYLADYIEPTRNFPGVDALRAAVYRDLDEGLALGLEMTVQKMARDGEKVHEKTLEALRFLKGSSTYGT